VTFTAKDVQDCPDLAGSSLTGDVVEVHLVGDLERGVEVVPRRAVADRALDDEAPALGVSLA
jgi:hypothetical protein